MLRQDSPRIALATAAVDTAHLSFLPASEVRWARTSDSGACRLIHVFAAQPTWYQDCPALTPSLSCTDLSHLAHCLRFISFSLPVCFRPSHEFYFSRVKILRTKRPFIDDEHQIERREDAQDFARRLVVLDDVTWLQAILRLLLHRRHTRKRRSRLLA